MKVDIRQPTRASHNPLRIGISPCLLGDAVRYDGGHKRLPLAVETLQPYVEYQPICPEMAIGLPSPRPTLGLYQQPDFSTILRFNHGDEQNIHHKISQFCQQTIPKLRALCGYIVCGKSPSCGLANAKLLDNESHDFIALTDGVFTAQLRQHYPWMPIEDHLHLADTDVQTHFMIRIVALYRLNQLALQPLTRRALLTFHSRYKYLLLAHSQPLYRQLGPFVAQIEKWQDLTAFWCEYRGRFMQLLAQPATCENHTNALMHIQGYFNRQLPATEKQQLTEVILAYRQGKTSLREPIDYLKACLARFPDDYIADQYYLLDYPDPLLKGRDGVYKE
ncbi:uncharacterized protein YbgA (DUF1722 family) [Orbus hercynius]|uniref:Uncharacterized protein YbgA (DUF1722 family) n=1 Tax=Orbus hercynius TaxID=593135 RepID=A0A495RJ93_9GAMM|nr:DUF1722 domain-containing protein [Orbus hercynius]RKS87612.1 uncharacterized protein YbgA (DUF1722 family) [Orbus hercynius]